MTERRMLSVSGMEKFNTLSKFVLNLKLTETRNVAYTEDLVYVPICYEWAWTRWTWPQRCIWDGPSYMREKYSLLPALTDVKTPTLTAFFVETLRIPNVSPENLTSELRSIKKRHPKDIENIHDIYTRLQYMSSTLTVQQMDIVR